MRSLRHIRRHLVGVGKRSDDVASLPVARPAASLGGYRMVCGFPSFFISLMMSSTV